MAEFERRWRRVVAAARGAESRAPRLGRIEHERLAQLARLARPSPANSPGMLSNRASEPRFVHGLALAAAAAAILFGVHCAWPDAAAFEKFTTDVHAELAELQRSVPSAPRPSGDIRWLSEFVDLDGALAGFRALAENLP